MCTVLPSLPVTTSPMRRLLSKLDVRYSASTSGRSLCESTCRAICTLPSTPHPSGNVYFMSAAPSVATSDDSARMLPSFVSTTTAFTFSAASLSLQMSMRAVLAPAEASLKPIMVFIIVSPSLNVFEACTCVAPSLPAAPTIILPGPTSSAKARSVADVPSCGPRCVPRLMFTTHGLPTLSA